MNSINELSNYTMLQLNFMNKTIIMSHPDYRADNQVGTKNNQSKIEYPQWYK